MNPGSLAPFALLSLALAVSGGAAVSSANGPAAGMQKDSTTVAAPAAARATKLVLAEGSTLALDGNSNVHRWHSKATALRLDASIPLAAPGDAKALRAAIQSGQPARFEIRIPVQGLKSGKDKLDANMYKALQEESHPEIVFTLDRYQPSASAGGDTLAVATKGRVRVAGRDRALDMRVVFTPVNGGLRVTGSANLKMTDFGIKPPTMMLGTLRTHDDVEIHFDLGLQPMTGAGNS